jgi:hypothetical protein
LRQHALEQHPHQAAAVIRRIDAAARDFDRLHSFSHFLATRSGDEDRPVGDAEKREPRCAQCAALDARRGGEPSDREIAAAARHFVEAVAPAGLRARIVDAHQELVGAKRRLIEPAKEFLRSHAPLAAGPAQHEARLERERAGRQLGGRIGERAAAAVGAAVSHREMRDMRQRERKQRRRPCDLFGIKHRGVPRRGTNLYPLGMRRYFAQAGNAVDVDEHRRREQPQVEHRHQALPACEHPRLGAVLSKQGDRFIQRLGARVAESRRLHLRNAASTAAGLTGSDSSAAPCGASASFTALRIAAGAAAAPASPAPFAPSEVPA